MSDISRYYEITNDVYKMSNRFGLSVIFIPEHGVYWVSHNEEKWLGPGSLSVREGGKWYMSQHQIGIKGRFSRSIESFRDNELYIRKISTKIEEDGLGSYECINVKWGIKNTKVDLSISFKLYRDSPYLVFTQHYPKGFENYSGDDWRTPSVIFPQFRITDIDGKPDLYLWTSGGMFRHRMAFGDAGTICGTVDVLMLADAKLNAMILSPLGNYLAATQQCGPFVGSTTRSNIYINCGIQGLAKNLPMGFECSNIMVIGRGISETFKEWGKALLVRSKKKVPSKYDDTTLKYLTYWDDYGAYYCQHDFKEDGYPSYEDVILGIEKDANRNGLNIGAYQILDLDQIKNDQGIIEPRNDLFPRGVKWLSSQLGKPLLAYTAWLYPNGPYRSEFKYFQCDSRGWIPQYGMGDVFYTREYWDYVADKINSWGCIMFQHDFLSTYEGDRVMMSTLERMDIYFKNMAGAMNERSITMQYCMQHTRNILESTENQAMISLQGTWDHHAHATKDPNVSDQDIYTWKHLLFMNSLYASLGIWPARDNVQPAADPNAYEDILISNLTAGPVELGHRIGESNPALLRKTFREGDGLLLKPDRPIIPIDRCYLEGGVLGYTESSISGKKWYYVLSLPPAGYINEFSIRDLLAKGSYIVYNYNMGYMKLVNEGDSVRLTREAKHEYFIVAPVLNNSMAVIGDTAKFITMADMRFDHVIDTEKKLDVGVISCEAMNPTIVGYSPTILQRVEVEGKELECVSSNERLKRLRSGWSMDTISKTWYVKMDFSDITEMEVRTFKAYL